MERSLMVFGFEGRDVRVVMRDGDPWWVAKDVAEILGYSWNGTARIEHVPEPWRGITSVVTPSGHQDMAVLSEQGLYFFLGRSDKPKALPFQMWLAGEVVPNIRRTGMYVLPQGAPSQGQLLVAMAQAFEEQERRLALLAQEQAAARAAISEIQEQVEGIQSKQRQAEETLVSLPAPDGSVPDLTWRAKLNRLVRSYCLETGVGHQAAWNRLYLEYRDRYHVDLKARAKGKRGPLDVAEEIGAMEQLYSLAYRLFGTGQ